MNELMKKARETMDHSYSPYSNFKVGSAIEMKDGTIFVGTNIENASYGATICAERVALTQAISAGYRPGDIKEIAIIGQSEAPTPPCNLCRQVMIELCDEETPVTFSNEAGDTISVPLSDLTPYPFGRKDLE